MDPTIWVAIVTAGGLVLSAVIGGLVAYLTNQTERRRAAESATEAAIEETCKDKEEVLRERLLLQEEYAETLEAKIEQMKMTQEELKSEIEQLRRDRDRT